MHVRHFAPAAHLRSGGAALPSFAGLHSSIILGTLIERARLRLMQEQPRRRRVPLSRLALAAWLMSLVAPWALFVSGGMRAVVGWLLLASVNALVGVVSVLAVLIHAAWKRRLSWGMRTILVAALVAIWPGLWNFNIGLITFPVSLARTRPTATVRLPSNEPLRTVWGGDSSKVNRHATTPDQRWAYDFVIGQALVGSENLTDYGCYGTPVVAPVSARVARAIDGEPDQVPGKLSGNTRRPLGNAVVFKLASGTFLIIAHLQRGSVRVKAGDTVSEGQLIGLCGNSGNTSEPHIHIHHQRQNPATHPVNFAEGLPLFFRDNSGPTMPTGGVEERDGKPVSIGATVTHRGSGR